MLNNYLQTDTNLARSRSPTSSIIGIVNVSSGSNASTPRVHNILPIDHTASESNSSREIRVVRSSLVTTPTPGIKPTAGNANAGLYGVKVITIGAPFESRHGSAGRQVGYMHRSWAGKVFPPYHTSATGKARASVCFGEVWVAKCRIKRSWTHARMRLTFRSDNNTLYYIYWPTYSLGPYTYEGGFRESRRHLQQARVV